MKSLKLLMILMVAGCFTIIVIVLSLINNYRLRNTSFVYALATVDSVVKITRRNDKERNSNYHYHYSFNYLGTQRHAFTSQRIGWGKKVNDLFFVKIAVSKEAAYVYEVMTFSGVGSCITPAMQPPGGWVTFPADTCSN